MLTPSVVGPFMIFLIPIVAIVAFTYRSYLKHTSEGPANKQIVSDLIDTVEELANRLEATRAERDAMRQRLQNLETIVTSEAWDERSLPSSASLDAQASTAQASTNDIARADATGAPASANASPQDRGRASTTDGECVEGWIGRWIGGWLGRWIGRCVGGWTGSRLNRRHFAHVHAAARPSGARPRRRLG